MIDWGLVASYALGSLIATTIGGIATVIGAVLLRRWLKNSPVLAGLASLPAALLAQQQPERRPATSGEIEAVRSDLAALGCTAEHPCGLPGCPGPAAG